MLSRFVSFWSIYIGVLVVVLESRLSFALKSSNDGPIASATIEACAAETRGKENVIGTSCPESKYTDVGRQFRLWCFSPKAGASAKKKYLFPCRCLSSIDKDDLILLPRNHEPTNEFAAFISRVLQKSSSQIIWTTGTSVAMDTDVDDQIINSITETISQSLGPDEYATLTVMPYRATKSFLVWYNELATTLRHRFAEKIVVKSFGESQEWMNRFGTKGLLHRHIADLSKPSEIETIDASIPVAKGFQCSTTEQLLKGYDLLGGGDVVIKPITGSAGEGIIFTSSKEELQSYDFPMGDIVLEERLEIDCASDGMLISPAVHYIGRDLLGGQGRLVDQLIEDCSYLGWRQSVVSQDFENTVLKFSRTIIDATDPQGPGGFDFLSVKGVPILSDINTGRFNGAHQPKLFLNQYATPDSCWYCWKQVPSPTVTVDAYWDALLSDGIAFDPHTKVGEGIFPLTHLRGIDGMYISIASTNERAFELYQRARDILTKLATKKE